MDLHLTAARPTDEERRAVDGLLGPEPVSNDRVVRGGHETRADRTLLLPALHALHASEGWISEGGLNYICERLTVPPAEAYGVATFYAMFSVQSQPKTVVHVCDDLACRIQGGRELVAELEADGANGDWTWTRSPCLGMCEQAPAIFAQRAGRPDVSLGEATVATVRAAAAPDSTVTCAGGVTAPQVWDPTARAGLRLLRRVGDVDPTSIDAYRAAGGYAALRRAVDLGPEGTIREVTDAKLLGRGGAAFPMGVKWKAVAEQSVQPRFVICNADESEPGTFKDRILMEGDPFAVLEGMTIAAFAVGAKRGYIYIRGEYPYATQRLEQDRKSVV